MEFDSQFFHILYKLWEMKSQITWLISNWTILVSKYIRLCWPIEREWLKFFLEGFSASWFFSPNFTDSELFIWPYSLLPQIQLPLFSDFPFSSLNLWHTASKKEWGKMFPKYYIHIHPPFDLRIFVITNCSVKWLRQTRPIRGFKSGDKYQSFSFD